MSQLHVQSETCPAAKVTNAPPHYCQRRSTSQSSSSTSHDSISRPTSSFQLRARRLGLFDCPTVGLRVISGMTNTGIRNLRHCSFHQSGTSPWSLMTGPDASEDYISDCSHNRANSTRLRLSREMTHRLALCRHRVSTRGITRLRVKRASIDRYDQDRPALTISTNAQAELLHLQPKEFD